MKIIIAGITYTFDSLDPAMDQCFVDLHAAYFSNQPLQWDYFKSQAATFFDKNHSDYQITAGYFHNFTIIWKRYISEGLWDLAEGIWKLALEPVIEWESVNKGKRIHKGSLYYFWGMTVIQRGDLDRGYALMHQALEEDVITHGNQYPDTPAFAFAALNYEKVDQAFREWVLLEAQYIAQKIECYCSQLGYTLTLDDFKKKFLQAPPSIDTIYILAYTIARLIRLESLPTYLLSSPFAGQLIQNLLFDLVQVVDVTVAEKNQPNWQMIDHIHFLSRRAGILISKPNLRDANSQFQADFGRAITEILDGSFRFRDGSTPTLIQADLLILYGLRNRGAHGISSVPITWQRFREIRNAVFNSLFLAVEKLY
ncbi:MAG: hypothetical protein ABIJ39_03880 [Chloroflexota bacterium]